MKKAKIEINYSVKTCEKISEYCKKIYKTEEHKVKISKSLSKKVFVYSDNTSMIKYKFIFYSETAKYFDCSIMLIYKYINNGKLFKEKWIYFHLRNQNYK